MYCPLKGTENFPQSQKYAFNSPCTYPVGVKLGLTRVPRKPNSSWLQPAYYKEHLESKFEFLKDNN